MTIRQLIRDGEFKELAEAQLDSKKRITLKRLKTNSKRYRIYANGAGQIILDPQVSVSASEVWLFENKSALESVRRGLRQSAEGKVKEGPSMAGHADLELG
ncbi:MAG: hypothetical protein HY748_07140 [Elusimicrobia bacterium]|nr:hypothetical protein [Elusimicrobiota bacterium]